MGIFIFKNFKFLYMYGDFADCTSRFSLSKYKDIFNSGKQKAVHVLPFFLSLHLWCWGLKQGPHCSSTAELHLHPFSLGLHVSVYCFHIMSFCQYFIEKEEDIIPSLYSALKLLSLHCWLLTERAGYLCGHLCFTTFHAMACRTPHFRAETLWHRSNQKVIRAILNTFRTELNWILNFRDFNQL